MRPRSEIKWSEGDVVTWRGIYRERVWHAQPVIIVKDSPQEVAVALLPGTQCVAPEGYLQGKQSDKRRWNFKEKFWEMETYLWRENRLLLLIEPNKFYSTILFWNHSSNDFSCYYINFQLPFKRLPNAIDTLDLDLDLIVHPDFTLEWKDENDYQTAIEKEIILPEWIAEIEMAKAEISANIEKRAYPFDGSWLNWTPEPTWLPPKLPENWDKV